MNAFQNKILKETTVTNQSKPYEPLTADNAALILVDHQIGLMTGVRAPCMRPQKFIGGVEVLPSLGDHAGSVIVVFGLSALQYVGGMKYSSCTSSFPLSATGHLVLVK